MTDAPEWFNALRSKLIEKRHEKAALDNEIFVMRKKASIMGSEIAGLEKQVKSAKENKDKEVHVSDHAILRLLERKYNLDIEEVRQKILTPTVIAAIRAGATAIETDGMRFVVQGTMIVTTLVPGMEYGAK